MDVDEDALANDMTLGNIPTIIPPTPYALCPPLDEYEEDNSWRTWACDTTYTEDGEFEKGMMFDSKKSLLEAIRGIIFAEMWSTERRPRTKLSLPWSASGVIRGDFGLRLILIYLHGVLLHIRVSMVLVYWVVTLFRLDTFTRHLLSLTMSLEIVFLKTHPLRYLSYGRWLKIVLV